MITLNMAAKNIAVTVPDVAFSLETGILTLQISLGTYDLTGKTITAVFKREGGDGVETAELSVVAGIIQLPITQGLVVAGINHVQLNIRQGLTLEQSPIMQWRVNASIPAGTPAPSTVDIITALIAQVNQATADAEAVVASFEDDLGEGHQLQEDLQASIATGGPLLSNLDAANITAQGLLSDLTDQTTGAIPLATSIEQQLREVTTPAALQAEDDLEADIATGQALNTTLTNTTIPAAQQAEESLQEVIDNSQIGSLDDLKTTAKDTLVDAINEVALIAPRIAAPKYGVSGVGGSAPALTKLWDLVGKTIAVGTDAAGATNDLDNLAPFNRRKCVGTWISGANEAIFVPQAYYGDPDYAEDGSKGDYVAVDIEPFWWYESSDGSTIGVSPGPQYGWEIHPICVNKRTGIVRDHTYIPVYALALKNGKAVSLPGYRNERGNYKTLWDAAKTYDGTAKQYAILEPSEIDHYEWLLQTIEFATTNPQTVMRGAVDMRYADDPITALTPTTGVVSATAGAAFVAGQNVYIGASYSSDTQASHKIDSIVPCDVSGNPAGSGYYLLTMTPYAGATDITTITTPKISTRPWNTGACSGVLSPSGSPVSNSSGKYPARYRWRENPYGNQNMTCVDLMNRLTGGNLEWYYLSNPLAYYPADVNKPDEAVLIGAGSAWTKLAVTPENYADGYIKKRGSDPALKHIKVPTLTAGASDNTYFSDCAYLVNPPPVRSVRRRGTAFYGSIAGPCYVYAFLAPGTSIWIFGGALFMVQ